MMWSAASPAFRCAKPCLIPFSTAPMKWCWSICRPTICGSGLEGKVYIGDRAERAIENFFRKGNLFALRELALRRTADRVDDQMRAWRDQQGRERVWHTRDAILLCIGDDSGSEKLVRTAARLAARLGSEWHAVYVETPRLHRLPEARRRAILRTLQLAQELGAETATLSEPDEAEAVLGYARAHNLGKIVTGRRPLRRWRRDSFAERLGQLGRISICWWWRWMSR